MFLALLKMCGNPELSTFTPWRHRWIDHAATTWFLSGRSVTHVRNTSTQDIDKDRQEERKEEVKWINGSSTSEREKVTFLSSTPPLSSVYTFGALCTPNLNVRRSRFSSCQLFSFAKNILFFYKGQYYFRGTLVRIANFFIICNSTGSNTFCHAQRKKMWK